MTISSEPARTGFDARVAAAIERCEQQIAWYEKQKTRHRRLFYVFQSLVIVLSGITPILILWTAVPKPIQALPAAFASIAAGLAGSFRWQEGWTRFAVAGESLKGELAKFHARASESYGAVVGDEQALENFVLRMDGIVMTETLQWRTEMARAGTEPKK